MNLQDFYNFLLDSSMDPLSSASTEEFANAIAVRRYSTYLNSLKSSTSSSSSSPSPGDNGDALSSLMEGPIRKKLGIIPKSVE